MKIHAKNWFGALKRPGLFSEGTRRLLSVISGAKPDKTMWILLRSNFSKNYPFDGAVTRKYDNNCQLIHE